MYTFGIEVEAYNVPREQVARALVAAGIACEVEGYNHTTRSHWKVVGDASIRGPLGFELVSPVLSGNEGLRQVRTAMEVLEGLGAKVNRSCGLHVHLGARGIAAAEIATLVRRYARFEPEIDAFMPPSRRGDANAYCRSLRGAIEAAPAARALRSSDPAEVCDAFRSRYHKVNLLAYRRHGTIEFRHHSGTVDAAKATNWIRFLVGFVAQSRRVARRTNAAALVPPETKLATLVQLMARPGGASIEDLAEATGWQRHTVRGAISARIRRAGYQVVTRREGRSTIYAIIGGQAERADRLMDGIEADVAAFYAARAQHFARRQRAAA